MGCSCILTKLLTDSHQYTHIPQTASIDFHSNRRHGKSAGRPFYTEQVHMAGKRLKKGAGFLPNAHQKQNGKKIARYFYRFPALLVARKYLLLMLS